MVDAAELEYAKEQGLQIRRHEGQERSLLRQMARHFGAAPDGIRERLGALSADRLEDLGEALLELGSYAEVEDWIAN